MSSSMTEQPRCSTSRQVQNFWIIVNYPNSDRGFEYDLINIKDLVQDYETLRKGSHVTVQLGSYTKAHGIVHSVSDNYAELNAQFKELTNEADDQWTISLRTKRFKITPFKSSRPKRLNRQVVKVCDASTQTDEQERTPSPLVCSIIEYNILKAKYEDLQESFNTINTTVDDVSNGLQKACKKVEELRHDLAKAPSKTPSPKPVLRNITNNEDNQVDNSTYIIGSNGTKVPKAVFEGMNWNHYSACTRKLLITLFTRKTLATHSLTGKPSPAFLDSNKATKMRLNHKIVQDIIQVVHKHSKVPESLIRAAITTKCADENKLYKRRQTKRPLPEL